MITQADALRTAVSESSSRSGVSWAAIFAGAAGAAALSLILILLGFGLGFSAVSPWAGEGASAKTLGISTIVWLAFTQIVASGLGGYLAGRLRVKWANMHGDEVYFRDTAHGFLSWAVATLVATVLIVSSAGGAINGGVQAGASVASGAASAVGVASASSSDPYGYFVDSLFRDNRPAPVSDDASHGIVTRIFAKTLGTGGQLTADDRAYLAQLVTQRTNLTQSQAEQRVDQVYGQAHQAAEDVKVATQKAADTATKVAAWTSLWTFISLLIGAFVASFAAIYGGRRRDAVEWHDVDHLGQHYAAPTAHTPVR
ncbi:hypothetical protein [Pseudomonas sp. dw_358]|uniref:hypothetical protein n=1 Tax=Pseudomonas sp. dw_358 TaxID=2720083 RepID=UPI001BD6B4DE|nr:hypothetical protein [Pseudomonas sp. dw_358]